MKPRIVRELGVGQGFPFALHEVGVGPAYLGLPWPKVGTGPGDCPYTPEQVMAACERSQEQWCGIPVPNSGEWWIVVGFLEWRRLTPEFIGEPKRCATCECGLAYPDLYRVCPECGKVLSDRRYYTQRKGERRGSDRDRGDDRRGHINTWFRPERPDRRTGEDRRKS